MNSEDIRKSTADTKYVGLGTMSFSDDNYESLVHIVLYAIANLTSGRKLLIDTARIYGNKLGDNERLVGKLFNTLTPRQLSMITCVVKIGINAIGPECELEDRSLISPFNEWFDKSDAVATSWKESSSNLGIEKHPEVEWILMLHRCHPDIDEFKKQLAFIDDIFVNAVIDNRSLIDGIGLSEPNFEQLVVAESETTGIDFVEIEFSPHVRYLIDTNETNCIVNGKTIISKEFLDDRGITVIAYSPLSRGFYCDNEVTIKEEDFRSNLPMWEISALTKLCPMREKIKTLAKKYRIPTSQLVIAWELYHDFIPIPGSSSMINNKTNIDAFSLFYNNRIPSEALSTLTIIAKDAYTTWGIARY